MSSNMDTTYRDIKDAANVLSAICHDRARIAGWWNTGPANSLETCRMNAGQVPERRIVQEKIALIHSEISEALEGHRKGLKDDHLPHRLALEVELADAVIRICDLAGGMGLDLGGAMAEKMAYNSVRPDHRPEVRAAAGGKAW